MKHSLPAALGLMLVMLSAHPALAQRRSGNVSTPYGTFSHTEMMQAGNDPSMAMQNRQMVQQQQMQMQMMKQQQQALKEQAKQAEFLKKNPDAAKALAAPATKAVARRMTRADREKAKREKGEVTPTTIRTEPDAKADTKAEAKTDTKPTTPKPGTLAAARGTGK